jgi:hypothetical protein
MTMTTLPAPHFCPPSPSASFWRRAAASETPVQTRSRVSTLGKTNTQLNRSDSSPQAEASDRGDGAKNRRRPALAATFKSP